MESIIFLIICSSSGCTDYNLYMIINIAVHVDVLQYPLTMTGLLWLLFLWRRGQEVIRQEVRRTPNTCSRPTPTLVSFTQSRAL